MPNNTFADFMSLELRDGYPTLLYDYGSGTIESMVRNKKLSDGTLHSISIVLKPDVRLFL